MILAALIFGGAIQVALAAEAVGSSPVRITRTSEGSPAARAGLRAGDQVVSVNGSLVKDVEHLRRLLLDGGTEPRFSIEFRRYGTEARVILEVEDRWTTYRERRPASGPPPAQLPTIEKVASRSRFGLPYAASVRGQSADFAPGGLVIDAPRLDSVGIPTRGGFPSEQRLLSQDEIVLQAPPILSSIRAGGALLRVTSGATHADLFAGSGHAAGSATSRWRGWGLMGWDKDEATVTGAIFPLSRVRYWGFECGSSSGAGRVDPAENPPAIASRDGFCVITVRRDSPADRAGILPGDLILKAGANAIRHPADLFDVMASSLPGQDVRLRLLRNGVELDVDLAVGAASIPARPLIDEGPAGLPFPVADEGGTHRATPPLVRSLRFAFYPEAPEPLTAEAGIIRTEVVTEKNEKPVIIACILRGDVRIRFGESIRIECPSARLSWATGSRAPRIIMSIGETEAGETAMTQDGM